MSSLTNEANLRGQTRALFVFGVEDKTRSMTETGYKQNSAHLQADKRRILNGSGNFTFRENHILNHPDFNTSSQRKPARKLAK